MCKTAAAGQDTAAWLRKSSSEDEPDAQALFPDRFSICVTQPF